MASKAKSTDLFCSDRLASNKRFLASRLGGRSSSSRLRGFFYYYYRFFFLFSDFSRRRLGSLDLLLVFVRSRKTESLGGLRRRGRSFLARSFLGVSSYFLSGFSGFISGCLRYRVMRIYAL